MPAAQVADALWDGVSGGQRARELAASASEDASRANPGNPDFNHAKGDAPSDGFFNKWTFFGIICLICVFGAVREQRKKSRVALV